MGRGLVYWGSAIPTHRGAEPQHYPIWGFFSVYDNTLRRMAKLGMVTIMGGRVFRSATPLHLHKYIAKFVSFS